MKDIVTRINENEQVDKVKQSVKTVLYDLINKLAYEDDVKEALIEAFEYINKYLGHRKEEGHFPEKFKIYDAMYDAIKKLK